MNTANVSKLIETAEFAKKPLVDFIPYEELQKLRIEVRGRAGRPAGWPSGWLAGWLAGWMSWWWCWRWALAPLAAELAVAGRCGGPWPDAGSAPGAALPRLRRPGHGSGLQLAALLHQRCTSAAPTCCHQRCAPQDGIDATRKEDYLSEEDFTTVFGFDRATYTGMPKWKQQQAKRSVNLF